MMPPLGEKLKERDEGLRQIQKFLEKLEMPGRLSEKKWTAFLKQASQFFVKENKLWRKVYSGRHQVIIMDRRERYLVLVKAHDQLGHKGFFMTCQTLVDWFWWPHIDDNICWFILTCHHVRCSLWNMLLSHLPFRFWLHSSKKPISIQCTCHYHMDISTLCKLTAA
jgi:hypothetical protein